MLSFVCFVFREGMWNGVQLNPVPLSPQYFITFIILLAIKYCFKDRGELMCFALPLCNFFTYPGLNSSAYT